MRFNVSSSSSKELLLLEFLAFETTRDSYLSLNRREFYNIIERVIFFITVVQACRSDKQRQYSVRCWVIEGADENAIKRGNRTPFARSVRFKIVVAPVPFFIAAIPKKTMAG